MSGGEFKLQNPPTDGISRVVYSPSDPNLLLVSSWDKTLTLHHTKTNQISHQFRQKQAILDCCFANSHTCFAGGLSREVLGYDFEKQQSKAFGMHDKPVKSIDSSSTTGLLATGGWDQTIKFWDVRTSRQVSSYKSDSRIFCVNFTPSGQKLVWAGSNLKVGILDLRNILASPTLPCERRKSPLLHQTRCVVCTLDEKGYCVSSTEGRVGVEYFLLEDQRRRFAFKCHRAKKSSTGIETLYPVNTMTFHPNGSMLTGGCDGKVISWDVQKRKRIKMFKTVFPTSISSLSYNCTGNQVAVASSYTFEFGDVEHPRDEIYLKNVDESYYLHSLKKKKKKKATKSEEEIKREFEESRKEEEEEEERGGGTSGGTENTN